MTTPETPSLPAHMQWKSRGRWAGRLSRASSFSLEDRNGHSIGQGLPLTEALGQPLLRDQACLRQHCQITGGHGVGIGSDSQELQTRVPGSHQVPWGIHVGGAQSSDSSAHLSVARAISSILATWLGHYPEDFFQPPKFPCLRSLLAYIWCNVPGLDLEQHAWLFLSWL